ncbi:uncharacterized protein CC84DRAFT_1155962 [Paraphaeosphaeria sporulosa]|uniref:Uncharacterized protein n=1 Tax=Paraphaeosphaeria sporulosa TaxID=1460663 RepID=A0A177BZ57_9PLEO|nr:uncharacterized protein CC84DRAFT_1155962 [Paraphaeosphaeria sporulosa]OAF99988.1 hypothetical protein CC84DRAFT_1155962 [Paraphaeosphaeria sporulosa]
MGVYYETIPDSLKPWILDQKMLFVGTAPLSPTGHINISPKGGKQFGIVSPTQFWYLDLTGSGVETHAHLHEPHNGRICVMFVAYTGPPRIVRIWGTGRAVENGTPEWDVFVRENKVDTIPGSRSIILVDVHQCATSCGFSVPTYEWTGWRTTLDDFFAKKEKKYLEGKEEESMDRYWAFKSQYSIDGMPGMKRGYEFAQKNNVAPLKKWVGKWAPRDFGPRPTQQVSPMHLILVAVLSLIIGFTLAVTMAPPDFVRKVQHKEFFL